MLDDISNSAAVGMDGPFTAGGTGLANTDLAHLPEEERRTIENIRKAAAADRRKRAQIRASASRKRPPVKSREWVLKKKERMRAQGKKVARDSKFSARRRPAGF